MEFKTETRYFDPCMIINTVNDFVELGSFADLPTSSCDICFLYDVCKKKGKPVAMTITYRIEVQK